MIPRTVHTMGFWLPTCQFKDKPEDMAAVMQQPILQFGACTGVSWNTGKLLILINRGDISSCLQRQFRAFDGPKQSMADVLAATGNPLCSLEVGRSCAGREA